MYSTRKIISGLVLLVVGVAMALIKEDIPPNLMNLMEMLYGAFVLGNGWEHATKAYTAIKGANVGPKDSS